MRMRVDSLFRHYHVRQSIRLGPIGNPPDSDFSGVSIRYQDPDAIGAGDEDSVVLVLQTLDHLPLSQSYRSGGSRHREIVQILHLNKIAEGCFNEGARMG
jgi:hypothetical protein